MERNRRAHLPVLFLGCDPGKVVSASRMSDVAPWPRENVDACEDALFPIVPSPPRGHLCRLLYEAQLCLQSYYSNIRSNTREVVLSTDVRVQCKIRCSTRPRTGSSRSLQPRSSSCGNFCFCWVLVARPRLPERRRSMILFAYVWLSFSQHYRGSRLLWRCGSRNIAPLTAVLIL